MSKPRRVIAIVEDDASFLKGLDRLLDTLGFTTELYSSAEDYFARAAVSEATCLLLDIKLGRTSGIELRRRLAAAGSRLPVIFMTALPDDEIRREAAAAGCVDFLHKPFPASALVDALDRASA